MHLQVVDILLCFHRAAYTGCYPNVQEFIHCATTDKAPSEKDLFHTEITYWDRKMQTDQITLNCREMCKEIAAATSRNIVHIRINYEGEFLLLNIECCCVCLITTYSQRISFLNLSTFIKAYLKELPSNKEVFIIRTKSLWQDWVTVNNLLGAAEDVPIPDSINEGKVINSQAKLPVTSNLSDEGRDSLCKLLRNEYILYIDLLNRAVNLSDDDIKSALDDAYKNCPAILESIGRNSYKISKWRSTLQTNENKK